MDYWEKTADFDSNRIGLRLHLEAVHGIIPAGTCTPTRDIVKHLTVHWAPGTAPDEFFPRRIKDRE